jgi:hypothetical protein
MGQTALLLCTIVPYLILRYFFGEMQLFAELSLLLTIFVVSGALTAITVGLSATSSAFVRILPLLGGMLLLIPIFGFAFQEFDQILQLFTPDSKNHWMSLLGFYLITSFIAYFFLELATTAIAPASQNRATRKRLIALPVVLFSFGLLYPFAEEAAWFFSLLLVSLLTLDLFTESTDYPTVVIRPFQRFGFFGKILARLLAPGWATGTFFYLLLLAALLILAVAMGEDFAKPNSDTLLAIGVFFGILNFNLLLTNLFKKKIEHRLVPYLLISVLLCGFIPLLAILDEMSRAGNVMMAVFAFLPQSFFFVEDLIEVGGILAISSLYGVINVFFAIIELRKISALEKEENFAPQPDVDTL